MHAHIPEGGPGRGVFGEEEGSASGRDADRGAKGERPKAHAAAVDDVARQIHGGRVVARVAGLCVVALGRQDHGIRCVDVHEGGG